MAPITHIDFLKGWVGILAQNNFFVKLINIARSSLRHGALDLNICRISLVESESVLWILALLLENVEY